MRLAQLDRAFGYGPKGRGFESSNARCKIKGILRNQGSFYFSEKANQIKICVTWCYLIIMKGEALILGRNTR